MQLHQLENAAKSSTRRSWLPALGFVVLACGLVLAGFHLSAWADPDDPAKKEQPKKAESVKKDDPAKKDAPVQEDVEEAFKKADEALKKAQKDMAENPTPERGRAFSDAVRNYQEAFRKRMNRGLPAAPVAPPLAPFGPGGNVEQVQKMMEMMMEQMKILQGGGNQFDQLQKMMEMMNRQVVDQMKQLQPGLFPGGNLPPDAGGRLKNDLRLGIRVEKLSPVLADQFDLPGDKGMVITGVAPDSAARKAGIKENDILLEIGGKAVPGDAAEFQKLINEFKPDQQVDVVVFRKGKKESIKNVTLPVAK
jgi:hypothetical protein